MSDLKSEDLVTDTDQLSAERAAIRQHVIAAENFAHQGRPDLAKEQTEACDAAIEETLKTWRALPDLLQPLLSDPVAEVRYVAAAHLLSYGYKKNTLPILKELELSQKKTTATKTQQLLHNRLIARANVVGWLSLLTSSFAFFWVLVVFADAIDTHRSSISKMDGRITGFVLSGLTVLLSIFSVSYGWFLVRRAKAKNIKSTGSNLGIVAAASLGLVFGLFLISFFAQW